jgi:glutamyl/glutaminyl-tRNA synthetase
MVTRVAPSPTGIFHLGTLRTAFLNYLMARANNGTFILRIDDTDQARNRPEWIDYIYDQMNEYGLDYDVTFKQSDRLDRYADVANKIGTTTEDGGYDLDMGEYRMVILRSNGYPTYNFCSILDDYDYDVTNIIRGVDHIANEVKQRLIWDKICDVEGNKTFPELTHAGLLFEGNKKLSKRSGNGTTEDYKDFSKAAMLNWLLKFGWSHPDPTFDKKYPTLSMDQMIELFNDGNISKNNCKIDRNKLLFLEKKWKSIERRNVVKENIITDFDTFKKTL